METVQGQEGRAFPDVTAFTRLVLRVFDEIADRQPHIILDRELSLPARLQHWVKWLKDDVIVTVRLYPPEIDYMAAYKII
jgi:hypothetical protein